MEITINHKMELPDLDELVVKALIAKGHPLNVRAAWDAGIEDYVLRVGEDDLAETLEETLETFLVTREDPFYALVEGNYDDDWNWARLNTGDPRIAQEAIGRYARHLAAIHTGLVVSFEGKLYGGDVLFKKFDAANYELAFAIGWQDNTWEEVSVWSKFNNKELAEHFILKNYSKSLDTIAFITHLATDEAENEE